MGRFLTFFLVISLLSICTSRKLTTDELEIKKENILNVKNGINTFSTKFYEKTAGENPNKNLVMSPVSAHISLALLSLGARGETQTGLTSALYLPDQEFIKSIYGPSVQAMQRINGVTLNLANKIFVQEENRFTLAAEFQKLAVDIFSAEAQNIDFTKTKKAVATINTWAKEKTNNKIINLFTPETLPPNTCLVIVNAIYFKGGWDRKFDPVNTKKADFYLNNNDKVKVEMMYQTAVFPYVNLPEWNAKAIELPYVNESMSMVIILPNEIEGLKSIEDKIASGADLTKILQRKNHFKVTLSLPKFKIETSSNLNNVLKKLGMGKIFSTTADFGGLLKSSEQLVVSDVIQKTIIEVNEEGAEAASLSAILMTPRAGHIRTVAEIFEVNRPFIFLLKTTKGSILFMGKYIK